MASFTAFKRMSLRQRFLVAPLLSLILLCLLVAGITYESRHQSALLTRVVEEDLVAFERYADVFVELSQQHVALVELLNAAPKSDEATLYDSAKSRLHAIQEATRKLKEALPGAAAGRRDDVSGEALVLVEAYRKAAASAVEMVTVNLALAPREISLANERFGAMSRVFERLLDVRLDEVKHDVRAGAGRNVARSALIALAGLVAAILLLILSVWLSRLLARALESQIGALAQLADQTGPAPGIKGGDEVERIGRAIEAFRGALTERKLEAEKVKRLNRVYAVLSGINGLIVRARERQELFTEACRIAVEDGNFGMVWIGLLDPKTLDVTPAAWAGFDAAGGWGALKSTARDTAQGRGTVGTAIRERRPVIVDDMALEPGCGGERRRMAIERGYRSIIGLPLIVEGEVVGAFALSTKEVGFFDAPEVKLLAELARDISFALEHIGKEEKLSYLAEYDALTGLANRAQFAKRLAQALHSARRGGRGLAVLIGDVNRFRLINDTFGRNAGDALLRELAGRVGRLWPDPADIGRVGSNAIAGILRGIKEPADVARLAGTPLNAALRTPFLIDGKELNVSLAIGVAMFPADGEDPEVLFSNAEAALKEAKSLGERYCFYEPRMNAKVAERVSLENKLRRALEKDEFVLHYQPKVDLQTRRIVGLEALIRWNDPESGLVPPLKFISLLEETGLILQVGAWALRRAARDHRGWTEQGLVPPRVAVNVSSIQLRQREFVSSVEQAILDGVAPTGIDLEITESLVMEDIEGNIAKLLEVRALGVNIAIDDFGTGYSSLAYLAKLPVQRLKIDRSFIITMLKDPDTMTLVETIISLAHSLRLKVVAEGVEEEAQAQTLRLLRCDEMQGYLFSKPLPLSEITLMLARARQAVPA